MADFTPIPQFLVGWTLALLVFVFCSFWEETLGAFILLAYFNLSIAAACCLIADNNLAEVVQYYLSLLMRADV
ncbi:hypothetical protein F4774DRAFT_408224 [Daldinia eschscholtzii]|nr:hypothetical protein F4774DRAFT_408224 [Daldinia eschscholtzii]